MALETTSTTVATRLLSYVLGSEALPPNNADLVAMFLCNDDDIEGLPSKVKQYTPETDLGAASAGTEGTAISTNTALGYDTAIQGTVVEGALVRAIVTDQAVSEKFPGMSGVEELLQTGDINQWRVVFEHEIARLSRMCWEKLEADVVALVTGLSNSVGTSGVDFSVADAFTAILTYDTLEPVTRDAVWLLTPQQVHDLRTDLAVAGGGFGGSVWFQQADAGFLAATSLPKNGLIGTFLGRAIYQYAHSLRVLSDTSANVNGALMARGVGAPDSPTGQLGAFGIVRRGLTPKVRMIYDPDLRGMKMTVALEYVAIEVRDTHGVRIRTDA